MSSHVGKLSIIKNILLIVFFIVILLLISYIVINGSTRTSSFMSDLLLLQNKLSYYVGNIDSETFDAYDDISILTSSTENGEPISTFNDEKLVGFADKSSDIQSNGITYYKLNVELINEELDVDLSQYKDIEFYVAKGINLKIKMVSELPKWWDDNFNFMLI